MIKEKVFAHRIQDEGVQRRDSVGGGLISCYRRRGAGEEREGTSYPTKKEKKKTW